MHLFRKLTTTNLLLNKKRTIVTIMGIILSVALLSAVTSMFFSARESMIDFESKKDGNYHFAFYNVLDSDVDTFRLNKNIESYYLTNNLGYAKLEGIKNENKPYIYLKAYDDKALNNLGVNLIKGRLPENSEEVVIPSHLETNGRVTLEVGDFITLDVGKRVNSEGDALTQNNPYDGETPEEIVETKHYRFKIVGIASRPSGIIEDYSAPGYTFITHLDTKVATSVNDVYVRFTKSALKNPSKGVAQLIEGDEKVIKDLYFSPNRLSEEKLEEYFEVLKDAKYEFNYNNYLITLETGITGDTAIKVLLYVAIVVIIIIIFTSIFCIKNSFDISVTERVRDYGMLRSVGATKRQIKMSVYLEALILSLIGIPLGILSGLLASYILIFISNYLLEAAFQEGLNLHFAFSLIGILFSALLGLVTILLSARRSAKKASKVSPIKAIRNSGEVSIKSKNLKIPAFISRIFGIGGEISYKNLKRSKKKYRTTVISIVVCSAVFIALSTFINYAFKFVKLEYGTYNYSLSAYFNNRMDEELKGKIASINDLPLIEEVAEYRDFYLKLENPSKYYTKEYQKINNASSVIEEDGTVVEYIPVIMVNDEYYRNYLKELKVNYEDNKDKFIYLNKYFIYNNQDDKYHEIIKYNFKKNDILKGNITIGDEGERSLIVGALTDVKPMFISDLNYSVYLIGNKKYHEDMTTENDTAFVYIKSKNANEVQKQLEDMFKDYDIHINNIDANLKQMNYFFTLVAIFLYGFITVIALIGITNIFNTITTNMNLRKREFAILKSIGMTTPEFNRMIRLESIFYGTKSLLIGIPIGLALSYLIYYYLAKSNLIMRFEIPFGAILITTIVVFILIFVIMKYSLKKISRQNVIETIRNENI